MVVVAAQGSYMVYVQSLLFSHAPKNLKGVSSYTHLRHHRSSLPTRHLEVVGERENGRKRGRHARGEGAPSLLACLLLARPFFLVALLPSATTPKLLLRRLSPKPREGNLPVD